MNKAVRHILQALISLILLWVFGFSIYVFSVLAQKPVNPQQPTDAIVVLTGGGGQRIDKGFALFSQGKAPHLFISGVNPDIQENDIKALWNERSEQLPECCITLGYKARTTAQNSHEVQNWISESNIKTIRLVTSDYHMPRALQELRHVLTEVEIIPHPVTSNHGGLYDDYLRLIRLEYHKFVFRWIALSLEPVIKIVEE